MTWRSIMDETCGGFLSIIPGREDALAITGDGGRWDLSRAALRQRALDLALDLSASKQALVLIPCRNNPATVIALLACFATGHAAMLIDAKTPADTVAALVAAYQPDFILSYDVDPGGDYRPIQAGYRRLIEPGASDFGGDLALLLATSGTTGASKFVRLSRAAVATNARQIAAALEMTDRDVGAAHLPLSYSYGLSIVTSHLLVGGTVHPLDGSVTTSEFWREIASAGATQFPGVPFHYNFLARAALGTLLPPTLKNFTQAGGALDTRVRAKFLDELDKIGGHFFAMYGQTEAAPRMTTLAAADARSKFGSVGRALNGARIVIEDETGQPVPAGETGAVIYFGPNVMLGYAEKREDLAIGDQCGGRLATGDLGYLDADGFLYLTGRASRFAKIYGLRLDLDEIERQVSREIEVAAIEQDDKIVLYCRNPEALRNPLSQLGTKLSLHPSTFVVKGVADFPFLANGKKDYAALRGT